MMVKVQRLVGVFVAAMLIAAGLVAGGASPAFAAGPTLEELKNPFDISHDLDGTVKVTYDEATKTFNITGNPDSKIAPHYWGTYYNDFLSRAVENAGGTLADYTVKVNSPVRFPDESTGLFEDHETKIDIYQNIDTSNVITMEAMFRDTTAANPDVSSWNTINVKNMSSMFSGAKAANPDVSNWKIENVKDMSNMFIGTEAANPDVSKWDTSKVTDMSRMFFDAKAANPDVSKWDTSNVKNMSSMFSGAKVANPDVSKWDTSNVTDMWYMFFDAKVANPDVSSWNTSKVTDMSGMFFDAKAANPDTSKWNLSSLVKAHSTFRSSAVEVIDVSKSEVNANYSDGGANKNFATYLSSNFERLVFKQGSKLTTANKLGDGKNFSLDKAATLYINEIVDDAAYDADPTTGRIYVAEFKDATSIPQSAFDALEDGKRYEIAKTPGPVAPTLTASDIKLFVGDDGSAATVLAAAKAKAEDKDSNDLTDTISMVPTSVDTASAGVVEVTLSVTDPNNGVTSTKKIKVTVRDKVAPTLTASDAVLWVGDDGSAAKVLAATMASATDQDGNDLTNKISVSPDPVDTASAGVVEVTLSVTDPNNGLTSTKKIKVTMRDKVAPTLTASDVELWVGDDGSAAKLLAATMASATDQDGNDLTNKISMSPHRVDTSKAAVLTVTLSVTDPSHGVITTKDIKVTVKAKPVPPVRSDASAKPGTAKPAYKAGLAKTGSDSLGVGLMALLLTLTGGVVVARRQRS